MAQPEDEKQKNDENRLRSLWPLEINKVQKHECAHFTLLS